MKDSKEEYYSLNEIVKVISSFLVYLRRKWWVLLLVGLGGAGLGLVYHSFQKSKYEAVCTFILEEKSAAGGLSGLASQFGLSLGGLNAGGGLFAGDNILDILRSKKVVQEVLLSPVDSTAQGGQTLADLYLDFTGLRNSWKEKPVLARINFSKANGQISPIEDSVLNIIYKKVTEKNLQVDRTNKQGSIIRVAVVVQNSLFARLMSERLVKEAAKLYLDIKVGTAEANIAQLQHRSDSLLILLNRKSFAVAASQLLDVNPAARTAIVPTEIANRDKTVLATLYAEVTKNLETSKVLLSQQTPVIQILDSPGYLLENKKKGRLFLMVVVSFVAGLLYVGGAFLFLLFKKEGTEAGTTGKK